MTSEKLLTLLNEKVIPYNAYNPLSLQTVSDLIGDARIVLMGESSHGTAEFYQARMALSQHLIREKGFHAILVEGDWTSIHALHHYCQGHGDAHTPEHAFKTFNRFPQWMWKNTLMLKFIREIREYNDQEKNHKHKIGIYGLDLYCLTESVQAILRYLQQHYPDMVESAKERYACFDHAHTDPQLYGYMIESGVKKSGEKAVKEELMEIYHRVYAELSRHLNEKEKQFYMTQNARVVENAEHYYRALFESQHNTWNIRDQHMVDTLQNTVSHLETLHNQPAKVIVWAHNSHVGDARATEMSDRQEVNLGQLVRERFNTSSFSLGFSTATGTVAAASHWDGKMEFKPINTPLVGSYEHLFHQCYHKDFLLNLRESSHLNNLLQVAQLQRAIGVIYRPDTERFSHYYLSKLPYQFDAIIHFDNTHELIPV